MHRRPCTQLIVALIAAVLLAGCGSTSSTIPSTTGTPARIPTPPTGKLSRLIFERSGGVAAPRTPQRIFVSSSKRLSRLSALIVGAPPTTLIGSPTDCADCRGYKLILTNGGTTRVYTFTEDAVPAPFKRLVAALSARL